MKDNVDPEACPACPRRVWENGEHSLFPYSETPAQHQLRSHANKVYNSFDFMRFRVVAPRLGELGTGLVMPHGEGTVALISCEIRLSTFAFVTAVTT